MITALFTPSGSGMAVTAIKALNCYDDVRTVAIDIDPLAPGLYLADDGYLCPPFDDEKYMPTVLDIVESESVDVVIPALDPILERFAAYRAEIATAGAEVMVSPQETIAFARDKWETYQRLESHVPFPESTIDPNDVDPTNEYFIKPRAGSGSEDAFHAPSMESIEFYFERIEDPIIQEYLPGSEYTIDCLTDDDGDLLVCCPRERVNTAGGISTKVEVVADEELQSIAERVAEQLTFTGPFFVQAKEDADGMARVTEIGPRIAGTMCGGFVEPSIQYLGLKQVIGGEIPEPTVEYGTKMTRHWCERYVETSAEEPSEWEIR